MLILPLSIRNRFSVQPKRERGKVLSTEERGRDPILKPPVQVLCMSGPHKRKSAHYNDPSGVGACWPAGCVNPQG